jgi:hypothetical protein
MSNYVTYKKHLLAKNSEAYSILSQADKSKPEERKVLLKKLDKHLQDVDKRDKELLERYK